MLQISVYDFFIVVEESQDDFGIPKAWDFGHFNRYLSRPLHPSSVLTLKNKLFKLSYNSETFQNNDILTTHTNSIWDCINEKVHIYLEYIPENAIKLTNTTLINRMKGKILNKWKLIIMNLIINVF